MAAIIEYWENLREIEQEIVRKGVALGIDWTNQTQLRLLADEALAHHAEAALSTANGDSSSSYQARAKTELFGLAALMLRTMERCALEGSLAHGGPAWKAFARALWEARRRHDSEGAEA